MFVPVMLSASYRLESILILLHHIEDLDEDDFNEQQAEDMKKALQDCLDLLEELSLKLYKHQVLANGSSADWKQRVRRAWETIQWDQQEIDNYRARIHLNITSFNLLVGRSNLYAMRIFLSLCETRAFF